MRSRLASWDPEGDWNRVTMKDNGGTCEIVPTQKLKDVLSSAATISGKS